MAQTDLSWTATVDRTWISVSPTAGTGSNNNITITVTSADTYGETDLTGTVTFNCTSCNPQQQKVVRVTRCAPTECVVQSVSYDYEDVTTTAECNDTSKIVTIPYTKTTTYETQGCNPKTETGSIQQTFTFPKNTGQQDIPRTFYYPSDKPIGYATITINQRNCYVPPTPDPCNCEYLSINKSYVSWDWNEISPETITITISDSCISLSDSDIKLTSGNEYFNFNYSNSVITVSPKNEYSGAGDPRTGTVTVKYSRNDGSGSCPDKTITLKQTSQGDPCAAIDINISSDKQVTCDGGVVKFTATETPKT